MIIRKSSNFHRHTARQRDFSLVGDKAWGGNDNFIIRIQNCGKHEVEGFRDSDCHNDFGLGKVLNVIETLEVIADRLPKHEQSMIGGVVSLTPPQGFDTCLDDGFRRIKIRLANP